MKQKGQAKQNMKKELKEMMNWMSSAKHSRTGYTGESAPVHPKATGYTDTRPPV